MKRYTVKPVVFPSLGILLLLLFQALENACAVEPVVTLAVRDAGISGRARYYADGDFIGSWTDQEATLQWELTVDEDATAAVTLNHSCAPHAGSKFQLEIGPHKLAGQTKSTGGWHKYETMMLGSVTLAPGKYTVTLCAGPFKSAPMNVKAITFAPLKGSARTFRPPHVQGPLPPVYVVPNFHPASCGWLANWSVERNYCANSYLNHLDRVRDDANYNFALSECNNMIAIANFQPQRFEELKQRVKEGRVELVNAFFLEPTINLSGGEALAKMGIEGLRWQQQVMGARPRFCWTIDVCGTHDQMPQVCKLLGLEALIYTRCSRGGKTAFWSEAPDGSKMLTLVPGHYADFATVMGATNQLTPADLEAVEKQIGHKAASTPAGAPVLFLGGKGDYCLAPPRKENPTGFLAQWKTYRPDVPVQFSTLSKYYDTVQSSVQAGKVELPSVRAGTGYTFDSFWIECPRVKSWYRRDEHALQASEMLATIASLKAGYEYPAQLLYHAWLQMLLNMDRNTLWGSAGGMVFECENSWDAKDRFEWVARESTAASTAALRKLAGEGNATLLFNPLNWQRSDFPQLPACGYGPTAEPENIKEIALPETIETPFYSARLDPTTGALISLKIKPSGREMLGGPANVLVTEKRTGRGEPGDFCNARPQRPRLGSSSDHKSTLTVTESALTITVEARTDFHSARRVVRFNKTYPRIEFTTEVQDLPDLSVLVAEFPLAAAPAEIRRGIPFGFSRDDNYIQGIVPAVRWSDYATPGAGGVALLDRGLTGREINDKTPVIYLYNAMEKYHRYANSWLSGKGPHTFEYALVAHEADWAAARVPQQAWEFNSPPVVVQSCAAIKPESFVNTSDNVILEAVRREGDDIELRLAESLGLAGTAEVTLNLPHESAALTDLLGHPLQKLDGGPTYKFTVRPQQIITMRCKTAHSVAAIVPLTKWDELVPENKRAALNQYLPDVKGHPPNGTL